MRLIFLLFSLLCFGQKGHLHTLAFYNVENLFDAQDHPLHFDEDYTPDGKKKWSSSHTEAKIFQLAKVIAKIGKEETGQPPLIIGLAEVEHRGLLQQLIHHPKLAQYGYAIAHFDSPDYRGIDVALLYRKNHFQMKNLKAVEVPLVNIKKGYTQHTRDILLAEGYLGPQRIYFLINHWPSRRGGKRKSDVHRFAAARIHRRLTDSIFRKEPDAFVVSMGDYNDNPTDKSLAMLTKSGLFNPSISIYKKGGGSLAYRDQWHLFDQCLFSPIWTKNATLFLHQSRIYDPIELRTPRGRYAGYPWRTSIKGKGVVGYSDHFPIYALIGQVHD